MWGFPSPRRPRVAARRWPSSDDGSDVEDRRRWPPQQPLSPQSTTGTPLLTLVLLKLEKILPDFCSHLRHATFESIAKACAILDSSISSSTSTTGSVSPSSPVGSFLHWLPDRSSSAVALEHEWESIQDGFLVLAAAEYLYQAVMHQVKRPQTLRNLYTYAMQQIIQVHATLCEPILASAVVPTPDNHHVRAARNVGRTLQCLVTLAQVRLQLIDLQSNLFTVGELDIVLEDLKSLLMVTELTLVGDTAAAAGGGAGTGTTSNTRTNGDNDMASSSNPVAQALLQELRTWTNLVRASWALERCEFFPSIVTLRHCQKSLPTPPQTRLETWFTETCRVLVSLLPIFFDRVTAFAKPQYDFAPHHETIDDWDSSVTDFLRKQEKGPPTAVAVVLDALGANNLHLERGYQAKTKEGTEQSAMFLPERTLWPAVYLRSTVHLQDTGSSHKASHSRTESSASANKYSSEWLQSFSEKSQSRLFGSPSTRNRDSDAEIRAVKHKNCVLEYGPDAGDTATSWPHSDWSALVSLLEINPVSTVTDASEVQFRMAEELVAVTYRDTKKTQMAQPDNAWKPSIEKAARLLGVYANSDMNAVDAYAVRKLPKQRSVFHVVSLSQFLSLVVIVQEDDDGHFLRRRNILTDEEIRGFMNSLAKYFNVTRRFSQDSLPKPSSVSRAVQLLCEERDNESIADYVSKIKSAFGMRTPSFPLIEGHRGISFLGRSPKLAAHRTRQVPQLDASAAASTFFLGAELAGFIE